MKRPYLSGAEGLPKFNLEDLEDPIRHVQHMASIVTTLLEECIVNTGSQDKCRIDRKEADDLIFAAQQVESLITIVHDRWEAI